jgi:hypothetical protein
VRGPARRSGRDLEHGAQHADRVGVAMILNQTEAHVRVPAKIAIYFFKMSRSSCRQAISAAWSADGSVA